MQSSNQTDDGHLQRGAVLTEGTHLFSKAKFGFPAVFLLGLMGGVATPEAQAADLDLSSSQPSPSLFDQKYLTGNWGGYRDELASHGFIFDFQLTQFYQGLLSGTGDKDWEYGGKADYSLIFVGDLAGLKGFTAVIHGETKFGHDINTLAGLTPPNVNMLYPEPNRAHSHLTGWLLTQDITDDGWALAAGKLNGLDLMDMVWHTGRGVDKFMNTAMVLPMGLLRSTNLSIMGAGVLKKRGHEIEGGLVFYDTNNSSATSGFDNLFGDGVVILGLWRFFYDVGDLAGNSLIFANYSTKTFKTLDPSGWAYIPGVGLDIDDAQGTWTVGYTFDQMLWADASNPKRNVAMSGQFSVTDGNPSPIKWTASVGLEVNGIASRDDDSVGLGFFYQGLSDDFVDLLGGLSQDAIELEDAAGFEVYYKMQLAPLLAVTADLQVVDTNVAADDTVVIGALRTNIKF